MLHKNKVRLQKEVEEYFGKHAIKFHETNYKDWMAAELTYDRKNWKKVKGAKPTHFCFVK